MNSNSDLTRRSLLYGSAAGITLLAGGAGAQPANRPPNIVFFLADDLGFADIACYGRPDLHTPNIDGIAAQGIRFLHPIAAQELDWSPYLKLQPF